MSTITQQLEEYETIGQYIKAARKNVNMTQTDLSKQCKVTRPTVQAIERDSKNSGWRTILQMVFTLKAKGAPALRIYQLANPSPKKP